MDQSSVKRTIRVFMRYAIRIVAVLVVLVGVAWFVFFRTSDKQADTSTTSTSTTQGPVASAEENKGAADAGTKSQTTTTTPTTDSKSTDQSGGKNLANTGPADVAAVFGLAVVAGALAWELRLRRAGAEQ